MQESTIAWSGVPPFFVFEKGPGARRRVSTVQFKIVMRFEVRILNTIRRYYCPLHYIVSQQILIRANVRARNCQGGQPIRTPCQEDIGHKKRFYHCHPPRPR